MIIKLRIDYTRMQCSSGLSETNLLNCRTAILRFESAAGIRPVASIVIFANVDVLSAQATADFIMIRHIIQHKPTRKVCWWIKKLYFSTRKMQYVVRLRESIRYRETVTNPTRTKAMFN